MDVKKYVEKYIKLCANLCKREEDYTKEKVKIHNKASKELYKLRDDIRKDSHVAEEVYVILLDNPDPYIKQSAATECLNLNIHVDASVKILKHISKHGAKIDAMGAKRILKIWRGELNPNDPF